MLHLLIILASISVVFANISQNEVQFLNELPLDKLLSLKNSLKELVTTNDYSYNNVTTTTPKILDSFGAQAMAFHAPIKRQDYEEGSIKKHEHTKMSNIFSMAVTTLAFLAFGGYLLCLIVQAVRQKQNYNALPTQPPTAVFLANKKRPLPQFSSYGRRKRDNRAISVDVPPEQLFSALLELCEGYAKWSERYGDSI